MRSANSYFPTPASGDLEFTIVGNLQAHPKAAQLLKDLKHLSRSVSGGLGHQMTACLETEQRVPVLVARVTGMHEWLALIGAFQQLDLADRLEHEFVSQEAFDAAFS